MSTKSKNFYSSLLTFLSMVLLATGLYIIVDNYKKLDSSFSERERDLKELQESYDSLLDSIEAQSIDRLRERDSLIKELNKRQEINKSIQKTVKNLEDKITNLQSKKIKVPESSSELVDYFNQRYETEENILIEDKVGLENQVAQQVSYELEEKDILIDIIPLKDSIILNKNTYISNLEFANESLSYMFVKSEEEIEKRKELQIIAEKSVENLKGQVIDLKRKRKFQKYLIPVGVVVGGFVGYKLAK